MPEQGTQKSASSTTNPYKVAVPLSPARTTPRRPTPPPFSIGRPTENREFAQCFERLVDASALENAPGRVRRAGSGKKDRRLSENSALLGGNVPVSQGEQP